MTQASDIYGRSLYELAAGEGIEEEICREAGAVRAILRENPDYIRLLSEPSIHRQERLKLLDDAFGGQIHPYLLNFLKLLTEKEMMSEFSACCRVMQSMYNKAHGIAEAVVVSAVPLSEEQSSRLLDKLTAYSGKKVDLRQKVDPSVLGGLRVEIDGRLLDGTVQSRLADLRAKVNNTVL